MATFEESDFIESSHTAIVIEGADRERRLIHRLLSKFSSDERALWSRVVIYAMKSGFLS